MLFLLVIAGAVSYYFFNYIPERDLAYRKIEQQKISLEKQKLEEQKRQSNIEQLWNTYYEEVKLAKEQTTAYCTEELGEKLHNGEITYVGETTEEAHQFVDHYIELCLKRNGVSE